MRPRESTRRRGVFLLILLGLHSGCAPALKIAAVDEVEAQRTTTIPATQTPTETTTSTKTCAENQTLAPGDSYASLACLPHLDAIDYGEAAPLFRAYDDQPVRIAILDGQFNTDHPDLKGAIEFTYNFNRSGCRDPGTSTDPECHDVRGSKSNHGTMIASLIAGQGQIGQGVVGVNPSARLTLLAGTGNNYFLPALRYAVAQRFDIITMSWSLGPAPGTDDVPEFRELLEKAAGQGTVVVMAAGNRALDLESTAVYPTRYSEIPGVVAVGSTEGGEIMAKFSNYGPRFVDLGAPGKVAGAGGDGTTLYSVATGTSFSGPLAAAVASRLIQWHRKHGSGFTAAQIEEELLSGSLPRESLDGKFREGRDLNLMSLWRSLNP